MNAANYDPNKVHRKVEVSGVDILYTGIVQP
jgi:hypothetical protein